MIANTTDERYVAYCRRVDTAPKISLEDGTSWFLLGADAKEADLPAVSCSDSEDGATMKDPTNDFDTVVTPNVNTAGNYDATWIYLDCGVSFAVSLIFEVYQSSKGAIKIQRPHVNESDLTIFLANLGNLHLH